jgi:D-tagatose-1,6-bisphosphate aldolase subunit GatZ/KbaZ
MQQAKADESILLIESTSNQVNQFGGYTGQTPAVFLAFVRGIAASIQFPFEQIVIGGDHLGPHVWRSESSAQAMDKASVLVRDSVRAGYTKIHLDCSMHCADDPGDRHNPLPDEIVSNRAAQLCEVAENAHQRLPPGFAPPLYVVGTEVPIPGGEFGEMHAPEITATRGLEQTLHTAKKEFMARGLDAAWERVVAVVVQPGVEFGDSSVYAYDPQKARELRAFAEKSWHGVYEAHSTDYQIPGALRSLVEDHFAILKVGPWLTFALREAVFALAAVEEEWVANRTDVSLSYVREQLDRAMIEKPVYWKGYYHGDDAALRLARKYSYSDRIRYYWPAPAVATALHRLLTNLTDYPPPISLLSQYLPRQSDLIREGRLAFDPASIVQNKIREVLEVYARACGQMSRESA